MAHSARYANALALAPMVRVGTLPSRLLALQYGADLVYTEEIIDFKMLQCSRIENKTLNSVDFVLPTGHVVFRTCAAEQDHVIFQMGTADAQRAVQVGKLVGQDVFGVDVNMGCPKPFSVKGGMGSALLQQPEKVREILTALVKSLPDKPVTCKIRLLPTFEQTMELCKIIESTGVAALGIHGRLTHQRPREPMSPEQYSIIREVAARLTIPVIANGGSLDISSHADVQPFLDATGCKAVMLARAAQWNMSVFRPAGLLPVEQVAAAYMRLALTWANSIENSKYCLMQLFRGNNKALAQARSLQELCVAVGLAETVYGPLLVQAAEQHSMESETGEPAAKRACHDPDLQLSARELSFRSTDYPNGITPKQALELYCHLAGVEPPQYETWTPEGDFHFCGVCHVGGQKFSTPNLHKSKKVAVQATARAALELLKL